MDKTAIIILHYQNVGDTIECVKSIQKNIKNNLHDIIIVTNATSQTDIDNLHGQFPSATFVENDRNVGFADGSNSGIKKALKMGCSSVVLLNNDTIVSSDLVQKIISFANKNPSVGAFSPKIYFAPGFEYHPDRYKEKGKGNIIWYAGGIIDWKNIYASHRGVDQIDRGQFDNPIETDFATGCCMFIRGDVLKKVGMFDSRYFLYYEDVDYSIRVKKLGYKVTYMPFTSLWHKNAQSSNKPGSSIHIYYQTRNRLFFGYRYAPLHTKKSLLSESIKLLFSKGIARDATLDFYLGRMDKRL